MRALPPTTAGVYPGNCQAPLLRANEQQFLFRNRLVVAGDASIAVQIERIKSSYFYPNGLSFQFWFTDTNGNPADPGAFEFDIQTSDFDEDLKYVTQAGPTGGLNASFVGRYEMALFWARYARVKMAVITNPVFLTAVVTR